MPRALGRNCASRRAFWGETAPVTWAKRNVVWPSLIIDVGNYSCCSWTARVLISCSQAGVSCGRHPSLAPHAQWPFARTSRTSCRAPPVPNQSTHINYWLRCLSCVVHFVSSLVVVSTVVTCFIRLILSDLRIERFLKLGMTTYLIIHIWTINYTCVSPIIFRCCPSLSLSVSLSLLL